MQVHCAISSIGRVIYICVHIFTDYHIWEAINRKCFCGLSGQNASLQYTVVLSGDKECSPVLLLFSKSFFSCLFFSAVNFGAIGVFMAHELLHAFYGYGGYQLQGKAYPLCLLFQAPSGSFPQGFFSPGPYIHIYIHYQIR